MQCADKGVECGDRFRECAAIDRYPNERQQRTADAGGDKEWPESNKPYRCVKEGLRGNAMFHAGIIADDLYVEERLSTERLCGPLPINMYFFVVIISP